MNSVETSSAAGPFGIQLGETDLSTTCFAPCVSPWQLNFGGALSGGAGATVFGHAFLGIFNLPFELDTDLGLLGPFPSGAFSDSTSGSAGLVNPLYSLTELVVINNFQGPVSYNGDLELKSIPEPASVPEPASMLLLGTVLAMTGRTFTKRWSV